MRKLHRVLGIMVLLALVASFVYAAEEAAPAEGRRGEAGARRGEDGGRRGGFRAGERAGRRAAQGRPAGRGRRGLSARDDRRELVLALPAEPARRAFAFSPAKKWP